MSVVNRAIKYRLYPTEEQKVFFAKTFGCVRKVYNLMLSDQIKSYQDTGGFCKATPAMYKERYPFLKEVDSLALANAWINLQAAFSNFFGRTRKKKNGFPKFKSFKRSKRAYTTNNQRGRSDIAILKGSIKLPKVKSVKAEIHRVPDENWVLKSATISQDRDGKYYASVLFTFEEEKLTYKIDAKNAIGLDYASDGLYVDNNGNIGTNHKYYRESHEKLARAQRRLSRMKGSKKHEKKSSNYRKQLRKVNKIHRHIANQRKDNLHKLSTEIANRYDVVCVEDLNMKAMSNKGFGNGKATLDNGFGMFLPMLEYKLNERGKYLIKVDKWYPSSQLCHVCGTLHPEMKDLKVRTMRCDCGLVIGRDQNAAINILNEGLRILAAR